MYSIYEHKNVGKTLKKCPLEIKEKYEIWKNIVTLQGPNALRNIKGFHDEALTNNMKGKRSSRLNKQYRVIYEVFADQILVTVENITPHDYRRKK
ncbi:MAG: type II toxin-antitoxin system mRNA interferase toxin, RelE/StbE family [Planctomycetes bacterium]|nr:type II toxin-antitoxin system mRNA interferase toxin, RelE/StbE family [Planctomycetota bacterium]